MYSVSRVQLEGDLYMGISEKNVLPMLRRNMLVEIPVVSKNLGDILWLFDWSLN